LKSPTKSGIFLSKTLVDMDACIFLRHFFKNCNLLNHFKMNKGDLINKVAESAGLTKAQATSAVNTVFEAVGESLTNGDKVTLIGFGTFSVSKREARQGRNPQTGQSITIAAKTSVKFKPGKELAESVN
jgi:DNA-binding protein HU-beta